MDNWVSMPIPVPSLEEQDKISSDINIMTKKIDNLMCLVDTDIALLKERRAALISAAVTGKIDIRNQSKANAA